MTQAKKRKESPLMWGLVLLPLVLAGGFYFFNGASSAQAALTKPPTSAQIAQGQELFAQNCASCHGDEGVGENPRSPKGGVKDNGVYLAPALNGTGHMWHHPNTMLFNTVKHGSIAKDSPAKDSPMKGFEGRLTDEEIVSVIQYLKSLWPQEIQLRHSMMPDQ